MNNPYEPHLGPTPRPLDRTFPILGAVGAWLASGYWAVLTLLIGIGAASGAGSGMQVIIPCVLIGLYAWRGIQLFKGDPTAAKSLLWLHGMGAVMAVFQIFSGNVIVIVLYVMKMLVHVFGAVMAYLAQRAITEHMLRS